MSTEPAGAAINELMERDPLELTRQDVEAIVKYLRKISENFSIEETKTQRKGKGAKVRPAKIKAETESLLSELGLEGGVEDAPSDN